LAKIRKYFLVIFFLAELHSISFAQFYRSNNFGVSIGAIIAVGNRFQRIGLNINSYYFYDFVQVNAGIRVYRNLKNLGPRKEYTESVLSAGLVLAYGGKQQYFNSFVNEYSNQTKRKFSIAYSYNAYFNKVKTKQQTGIVALQFDKISIIAENDILAKPFFDRFRTGAFLIQYQYRNIFQAAINCTMWTGQMGRQVMDNENFKRGYMDTTGGVYANISHGLLSTQLKYNLGYGQNAQLNLGIDAEQVRNFVQNKLIHDLIFIPRKWFKQINSHIPMLDRDGNQYLFKSSQEVKRPHFYWNTFSNSSAFY